MTHVTNAEVDRCTVTRRRLHHFRKDSWDVHLGLLGSLVLVQLLVHVFVVVAGGTLEVFRDTFLFLELFVSVS